MSVLDKTGLADVIAALTPWSRTATEWDPDPSAYVGDNDRGKVILSLLGIEAVGVDEHRIAYNPGGYPAGAKVTTEIGNREVTINVRVEAYDAGTEAAEVLDMIRTGIRAEAVVGQLNALNLALIWMTKTTRQRYVVDQRAVNAATADLCLGGIGQLVSKVEVNQGWVDVVDGNNIVPGTFT